METEYNSSRLGLTKKRAAWLVKWLREVVKHRLSTGPGYVPGIGAAGFRRDCARLGEAFLRSAICLVLRDTGEDGPDEATLQRPDVGVQGAIPLVFYTNAKAEDGRAWIGGFLDISPRCQKPWFSLEVEKGWAPWAFCQRGYEEGYCRPRAPCYPDRGEALGPRGTDKADHSGSYQRIYGQPVQ